MGLETLLENRSGAKWIFFMVHKRASQWMPGYVKGLTHGTGQSPSRFPLHSDAYSLGQDQPNKPHGISQDPNEEWFLYHLIKLLLTKDLSKEVDILHFLLFSSSVSSSFTVNSAVRASLVFSAFLEVISGHSVKCLTLFYMFTDSIHKYLYIIILSGIFSLDFYLSGSCIVPVHSSEQTLNIYPESLVHNCNM